MLKTTSKISKKSISAPLSPTFSLGKYWKTIF